MGMTIVPTRKFIWGIISDKPKLPNGFSFIESPRDFLKAVGPDGRKWYVGNEMMIRLGTAGDDKDESNGVNKKEYADERETIDLT
jgi:hypothetical protein